MSAPDNPEAGECTGRLTWEQAVATLLEDPEHASLARDCYFDGTAAEAGARYWASEEWQAVHSLLPEECGKALDIGAGRGIASYALARDGWQVSALEPDGSALVGAEAIRGLAAATGYPIEVFQTFGEDLPFDDRQFDLILARQSLHHARDLRMLMRELYRVLRPGGRLIALRDHVISRAGDLSRFHATHSLHRVYGGEHAYLLEEYTSAFRSAGFSLIKIIAPLVSPINFAPLTRKTLAAAVADRIPDFLGARRIARWLLRSRPIMALAVTLLGRVDNRPGRLYSFVADRRGI